MATTLSAAQAAALAALAATKSGQGEASALGVSGSAMAALERRGMVKSASDWRRDLFGEATLWKITTAGRRALAEITAPAVDTRTEDGAHRVVLAMVDAGEMSPAARDMVPSVALTQWAEANALTMAEAAREMIGTPADVLTALSLVYGDDDGPTDLGVCDDCAQVIANGEIRDGRDDDGASVAEAIARRWAPASLVLDDGECDPFSSAPCDGCGSDLAGARHPAAVIR